MMEEGKKFLELVNSNFPVKPIPSHFFWQGCKSSLDGDIPRELYSRVYRRLWTDITIFDWRMIGASPCTSRLYIDPLTFIYYVPSILVGVILEVSYIDYALESIIPYNKRHIPRGEWWHGFSEGISPGQHDTFLAFLNHVRLSFWDSIGEANQSLVHDAESIWAYQ